MKKLLLASLLLSTVVLFSACDKLKGNAVTFYVTNAGTAGKWDNITVNIGGKSGSFFTPERRNLVVTDCEGAEYSITFDLPPGTYTYTAKGSASWEGSVTLDNGDCKLIGLRY